MKNADDVVAAARAYLGVPFAHQGRTRHGLDCLGLLVCVAKDLALKHQTGLLADADELGYSHYPDSERLKTGLEQYLKPSDTLIAGNVVLMRVDSHERHLGLIGGYSGAGEHSMIHAYAPARKVVEHHLSQEWRENITRIYTLA